MNKKLIVFSALLALVVLGSLAYKRIDRQNDAVEQTKITIDWVPSAEYVGFFVAKERGLYREIGFEVDIQYGSGAPNVTQQIAAGSIELGTSTSDNVIRAIETGSNFRAVRPLLIYNPSSLITRERNPTLKNIVSAGAIGVNVQSATYNQFKSILVEQGVPEDGIEYYPIGYGGPQEFISGKINSFIGYTTNHAVQISASGVEYKEIMFGDLGIKSMGLVLVASVNSEKISDVALTEIMDATESGYSWAFKNPDQATEILLKVEPTLDRTKVVSAITKMQKLNSQATLEENYDLWLTDEGINLSSIETFTKLLSK